eukprot:4108935-Amphidinium_carterae.1
MKELADGHALWEAQRGDLVPPQLREDPSHFFTCSPRIQALFIMSGRNSRWQQRDLQSLCK